MTGTQSELGVSASELDANPGFGQKAVAALAVAALGYAAAFLSGIVTARTLGAAGKGVLSLFLTTVAGLSEASSLGIGQGQIYHAAKAPSKLRFFLPHALLVSVFLGSGSALVYVLVARNTAGGTELAQLGTSGPLALLIAVPVFSYITFQRQYLLTIGRFTAAKAIGSAAAAAPLLAIGCQYLVTGRVTLSGVILGIVTLLSATIVIGHALTFAPNRQFFEVSVGHFSESLSFGVRQWANEVTHFLAARLDFFIVAWLLGSSGLGIYSVAVGIAEMVSRLSYELGTMIFPAVAGGKLRTGQAAILLRTSLAMAGAMALVLGAAAVPLVNGLYGVAFAKAAAVLQVLLIGTVAWSAAQILWLYTSAAGRVGVVLLVLGGTAMVDVALNVILLPRFGVLGAGISASISYCLAAAALLPLFCRREECSLGEALLVRGTDLRRLANLVSNVPKRLRSLVRSSEQT